MTRIRSTREVRITPPAPPRASATSATSAASGKTAEADADAQRFGALFETARLRVGEGERDDMPDQEAPDDPTPDDDGSSDDTQDREAAERIDAADAPLPLLPAVPPLPPLQALNGALLAIREQRRTSALDSQGVARKTGLRGATSASGRQTAQVTQDAQATQDTRHVAAEPSFDTQMIRRCTQAIEGDLLAEHLAERVAGFCTSPAVERTGQWDVAVELDPSILPRTELRLSLSGWGLSLRFDSRDARARQLICDNSNELKTRLETRLGGRIAVEVTVI
ncbi:type III secretion system protein SctP [Paraburkholderia sp. 22099]|jgi:hypothetical protein|uniref:type III secretion system protein SctP n=1 Tax=Paraburkholderia TaxID=1822464 RepID=UPI002866BCBB|nr:type III secretion system protein SctP [Paraburkholderia terricola]MDR6491752.1 hypothetical protein [Paraburkholderia terricola]